VAALHPNLYHDGRCFHYLDPVLAFEVSGSIAGPFDGRFHLRPELSVRARAAGSLESTEIAGGHESETSAATAVRHVTDFAASITAAPCPAMAVGEIKVIEVHVLNRGADAWPCSGSNPVRLAYHWLATDGRVVEFEGLRTPLPHDVQPGRSARAMARVLALDAEGPHVLQWTLVQEGVAWFEERDPTSA
jgi:hypothetical protein